MEVEPPILDPLEGLPPRRARIVETTRRLLVERGYSSLSLEAIADECKVNKTAVRYYFKNKAGLMALVVDSWVHDNVRLLLPAFSTSFGQRQLHAFVLAKKELSKNTEINQAFFELLPELTRDARHGERAARCMSGLSDYRRPFAAVLEGMEDKEIRGFMQLLIAVVDGLAVQYVNQPEHFDPDAAFVMLESILTTWIGARLQTGHTHSAAEAVTSV